MSYHSCVPVLQSYHSCVPVLQCSILARQIGVRMVALVHRMSNLSNVHAHATTMATPAMVTYGVLLAAMFCHRAVYVSCDL